MEYPITGEFYLSQLIPGVLVRVPNGDYLLSVSCTTGMCQVSMGVNVQNWPQCCSGVLLHGCGQFNAYWPPRNAFGNGYPIVSDYIVRTGALAAFAETTRVREEQGLGVSTKYADVLAVLNAYTKGVESFDNKYLLSVDSNLIFGKDVLSNDPRKLNKYMIASLAYAFILTFSFRFPVRHVAAMSASGSALHALFAAVEELRHRAAFSDLSRLDSKTPRKVPQLSDDLSCVSYSPWSTNFGSGRECATMTYTNSQASYGEASPMHDEIRRYAELEPILRECGPAVQTTGIYRYDMGVGKWLG